jgi:hypothetical protein
MTHLTVRQSLLGRGMFRVAVGMAAVILPVAIGIPDMPQLQAQPTGERPQFEVASIKRSSSESGRIRIVGMSTDRAGVLNAKNMALRALIA